MRMTIVDLFLKAGAIALVTLLGCTAGRVLFLMATMTDLNYWPSAAAIEAVWVAPFGAVPAAAVALVFMVRERRHAIRRLKRLSNNPALTTADQVALVTVLDLLQEERR